jgi:hypothetical protein
MLEFESKEKEKKISKANGKQIEKGKQNQPNSPSSSSQPNSAWRPSTLARSPPRFTLFPPRGPAAPPPAHPAACGRAPPRPQRAPRRGPGRARAAARPIRVPGPTSPPRLGLPAWSVQLAPLPPAQPVGPAAPPVQPTQPSGAVCRARSRLAQPPHVPWLPGQLASSPTVRALRVYGRNTAHDFFHSMPLSLPCARSRRSGLAQFAQRSARRRRAASARRGQPARRLGMARLRDGPALGVACARRGQLCPRCGCVRPPRCSPRARCHRCSP